MFRQSTKKLLNFFTLSDYDFFITFIDEYCEMFWMGKLSNHLEIKHNKQG